MKSSTIALESPAPASPMRQARLTLELIALFFLLPTLFWSGLVPLHVILMLWVVSFLTLPVLLTDPAFDRRRFWRLRALRLALRPILIRFAVLAGLLGTAVALLRPDLLFIFPRTRPNLWMMVMVLYPLFSVLPQGLVYRIFFFHRYRELFPQRLGLLIVASIAFGYTHIVFDNWVAIALTLPGGFLFGDTYLRTRSGIAAAFEHALYGCFVITIGLGQFIFYPG